MKKTIISLLIIIIPAISFAQEKVTWDFPVKPGTEKWKKLKTNEEKFESLQIPSDIITNLSTEDLVKSCLNFPAYGFYTAYNSSQIGFIILAGKFNGLQELSKREDALMELIEIYKMAGEDDFDSSIKEINSEYWTIKLGWIELMLSQRELLKLGTDEDKKKLMGICLDKYNMKISSQKFSTAGAESTLFLMARILDEANNQAFKEECLNSPEIKEFTNTSVLKGADVSNEILKLSKQFQMN
jgi:hypothetical protein